MFSDVSKVCTKNYQHVKKTTILRLFLISSGQSSDEVEEIQNALL